MVSDDGIVNCIDAATGEPRVAKRIGGKFAASPIYADGRIYFCDQDGKTTVIKPGRKFEELATNTLDDGLHGLTRRRRPRTLSCARRRISIASRSEPELAARDLRDSRRQSPLATMTVSVR